MKSIFKLMGILSAGLLVLFMMDPAAASDLIEPTRTLQAAPAATGDLAILSEPPGLDVALDGTLIGKTPVFLDNVKSGAHTLRVKNSETAIHLEPGATLQVSLFKGEFIITALAEKETAGPQALEEQRAGQTSAIRQPRKEGHQNDLSDWERFTNRSLNHF